MVATRSRTPVRGAKKEAKAATQKTPAAKKKAPAAKKKAPAAKKAVTPKRGRGRAKKSQKEEPEEPAKEPVKPVDPVHIEPVGASVDAMKAPSQSSTVPYYSGRVNSVQANQGILNLKPWLPLAVEPAPVKPAKPSEPAQEGVATSTVNPAVKTSGKISGRFWKHKEASRHSSIKKSTKSKTKDARWKARMEHKKNLKDVRTLQSELNTEAGMRKQTVREKSEAKAKRREENEVKSQIVQQVTNTAKLKKLNRKQLRMYSKR